MEPAGKKKSKSEMTRDSVFRASVQVMNERGYQNTKVRDICQRARISTGTFYNYFTSKNDIILCIFTDYINDVLLSITESDTLSGTSSLDKLNRILMSYARTNEATGIDNLKLIFNHNEGWNGKRWLEVIEPLKEILLSVITAGQENGEIRTDRSARHFTEMLLIVARVICYDWCFYGGKYDLPNHTEDLASLVLESMSTKGHTE